MRLIWILGLALAATIATAKAGDRGDLVPGAMIKLVCASAFDPPDAQVGRQVTEKISDLAKNSRILQVSAPGGAGFRNGYEICVTVYYAPK